MFVRAFCLFSHAYSLMVILTLRRGLLTRRQLTTGPEFQITLKPSEALDGFHLVFGTVLQGFDVSVYLHSSTDIVCMIYILVLMI